MDGGPQFDVAGANFSGRAEGDTPKLSMLAVLTCTGIAAFSLVAIVLGFGPLLLVPVAALGIILMPVVAFSAPIYLLYLVPVLMAIEYRVRIGPVSFSLAETAVLLAWVIAALHIARQRSGLQPEFTMERRLIAWLCLCALPSVFFESDLKHALSTYRDLIVPLLFLCGMIAMRLRRSEVTALVRVFVLFATATAVLGIAQYLTGRFLWLQSVDNEEWQEFKLRLIRASPIGAWLGAENSLPIGLYQSTNDFGNFLMLPLCVAFAWVVGPEKSRRVRFFWASACAVMIVALALCFFRSGVLTIFAIVMFWMVFRKRKPSLRALSLAGLGAAVFLGVVFYSGLLAFDQFGTVSGRVDMLTDAFRLLWEHPIALFVGGFSGAYHLAYDQVQMVHNLALYSLIRFGLLATIVLYVLYARILGKLKDSVDHTNIENHNFLLLLFAGLAFTILLYGQTATVIDNVQNNMWLSFWFGVSYYYAVFEQKTLQKQQLEAVG